MECQLMRGLLRLHHLHTRARCLGPGEIICSKVVIDNFQTLDRRLYHRYSPNIYPCLRPSALVSSPVLSQKGQLVPYPSGTRTVIISKVISAFQEADLTSIGGLSKFILQSTPVNSISNLYEWVGVTTGLPWAANIVLCSFVLQLAFNVPANIYLARWVTAKERHTGDMVAISSSVMRAPSRENAAMYGRMFQELSKHYGCEKYKLFSIVAYQVVCITITSFAVRALLINPQLGVGSATLPWGSLLGVPDLILPFLNASMSVLLVEIANWKKQRAQEGLKLSFKRAGVPYTPEPLYLINLRRLCSMSFLLIYAVVPSAMTLHWSVLTFTSINSQILLAHKATRQRLRIPSGYYETENPYKDFLNYLKKDMTILKK